MCANRPRGRRRHRSLPRAHELHLQCGMRFVIGVLVAIAIAVALVAAATRRFHRRIDGEARALLVAVRAAPAWAVEASELARLPPPVRRWLEASGAMGRPRAATVRLK